MPFRSARWSRAEQRLMPFTPGNSSDHSANASFTLSNGNLTFTATAAVANPGVGIRAVNCKRSGKYYIEYTVVATNSGAFEGVGFSTGGIPISTGSGQGPTPGIFLSRSGGFYQNQTLITSGIGGTWANGTVLGIAIDLDNRLFWARF